MTAQFSLNIFSSISISSSKQQRFLQLPFWKRGSMAETAAQSAVTLRLIRSFPHRNVHNVIFHNVDLNVKVSDFMQFTLAELPNRTDLPPPFRKFKYDTMKIEFQPHGNKSSDPLINTANDEKLILNPDKTLAEQDVVSGTDISCFTIKEYEEYKKNRDVSFT